MTPQCRTFDCDVVVVNYNAGRHLKECVESALAQRARHVYVVDNASDDNSLSELSSLLCGGQVVLIRNLTNLGFAAACNIGARASTANVVLFLNPDCVLTDGSLLRLMNALYSETSVGMVGGLVCHPDGSEQPGCRRYFPSLKRAFMRASGLSHLARWFPSIFADFLLHTAPLPRMPITVDAISGACMLVKRVALEHVGFWDDGYFLHCEDLDWCMRFWLKRWRVVFVPDAKVIHVGGACSRSRPFFVEWHKHRGMLRFYNKFFRAQYPKPLSWLVIVGIAVRLSLASLGVAARLAWRRLKGLAERPVRA